MLFVCVLCTIQWHNPFPVDSRIYWKSLCLLLPEVSWELLFSFPEPYVVPLLFMYAGNNVPLWTKTLAVNNGISALTEYEQNHLLVIKGLTKNSNWSMKLNLAEALNDAGREHELFHLCNSSISVFEFLIVTGHPGKPQHAVYVPPE